MDKSFLKEANPQEGHHCPIRKVFVADFQIKDSQQLLMKGTGGLKCQHEMIWISRLMVREQVHSR